MNLGRLEPRFCGRVSDGAGGRQTKNLAGAFFQKRVFYSPLSLHTSFSMAGLLGSALGDQLVKAGLATEEQLEKSKLDKKKPKSGKRAGGNKKSGQRADNRGRKGKPRKNANTKPKSGSHKVEVSESIVTRQVSKKTKANELIRKHLVVDPAADQAFNFAVNGKLREITVTAKQAEQISQGELAIVKTDVSRDPYVLVPAATAVELRELQPGRIAAFYDEAEDNADEQAEADNTGSQDA